MPRPRDNTKVLLFNPMTCEKTLTTIWYVKKLLGVRDISYNYNYRRKVRKINCYILPPDTPDFILIDLIKCEKINGEVWADIEGAATQWQVSNFGRYRRRKSEDLEWQYILLKPHGITKVPFITPTINGKYKFLVAKRMVAKYFLHGEYDEWRVILQIDGNKFNCAATNLKYLDQGEKLKRPGSRLVPVYKVHPEKDIILDEYCSISEACRQNIISNYSIQRAIDKKSVNQMSCGYRWFRADDIACRQLKFEEEDDYYEE